MTKFEELCSLITRNKNNKPKSTDEQEDIEVAGSEPTKTPIISFGDDNDLDLIEQLHFKERTKPLQGNDADRWDD